MMIVMQMLMMICYSFSYVVVLEKSNPVFLSKLISVCHLVQIFSCFVIANSCSNNVLCSNFICHDK